MGNFEEKYKEVMQYNGIALGAIKGDNADQYSTHILIDGEKHTGRYHWDYSSALKDFLERSNLLHEVAMPCVIPDTKGKGNGKLQIAFCEDAIQICVKTKDGDLIPVVVVDVNDGAISTSVYTHENDDEPEQIVEF